MCGGPCTREGGGGETLGNGPWQREHFQCLHDGGSQWYLGGARGNVQLGTRLM